VEAGSQFTPLLTATLSISIGNLWMNASSTFQILLIMSHPPLVSSLVDVLVNGDEVASDGTPEDSPLPLRKVRCSCDSLFNTLVSKC